MKARRLSAEHKARIAATLTGHKFSKESKAKMRAAKLGMKFNLSTDLRSEMSKRMVGNNFPSWCEAFTGA